LPRGPGWGRTVAVLAVVLAIGVVVSTLLRAGVGEDVGASLLQSLQDVAPDWLVDLAKGLDVIGDVVVVSALRWGTIVVIAVYRRWRHLVVFLGTFVLSDWVVLHLVGAQREPPAGLESLTERAAYWFPSRPVAALSVTLAGMAYVLAPAGGRRRAALWVGTVVAALYAFARLVLAADYPFDVLYSVVLGPVVAAAAFAAFVPDHVFPIVYARGGKAAHLDLGGERGTAIVKAMADQLGFTVTEAKAFGLEGSGGSSPLRMRVEGLDGHLFAKIYSTSHLRADRWYRIGRTLMYGQLEDEVPFASVRRLVEYEDYALRLLDDLDVRVAKSYGVVELTPNREYMLVTEFFEGSKDLGDSEIDDTVIDEGIGLVRTFWDAGLAHRDLKPANLLVKDGHIQLVDVSGLEVRPTPWRQAVDLANMMMTLALQTDPDRVYARATTIFTPDEISEGFASAVGLAVPTQVQQRLKEDPRPILQRFKELAPARQPVSIQRWSLRRAGLAVVTVASAVVLAAMFVDSVRAGLT